jgi:hypothetical protein
LLDHGGGSLQLLPLLPAKINRELNSKMEKVVKTEIKFGLPFIVPGLVYTFPLIVPGLVYTFQMICS